MSNRNLVIDLQPRVDKNGKTYHIGKLRVPALIDCKEGVVFLVYTSEPNCEQIQIAGMDNANDRDD